MHITNKCYITIHLSLYHRNLSRSLGIEHKFYIVILIKKESFCLGNKTNCNGEGTKPTLVRSFKIGQIFITYNIFI